MKRARDSKGRFKRAAPPIDPALVAQLGKDRRAVSFIVDFPWELTILDEKAWREWLKGKRPDHGQESDTTQAGEAS